LGRIPASIGVSRARWITWGSVLIFGTIAAVLSPRIDPGKLIPENFANEHLIAALLAIPLLVISYLIVERIFLRLIGLQKRQPRQVSREVTATSVEADALVERAQATLVKMGWAIGAREPMPSGDWRASAFSKRFFSWGLPFSADLERLAQTVEFVYTSGFLRIIHRFHKPKLLRLQGETDYQHWLLEMLIKGVEAGAPPRRLSDYGIDVFVMGFLMAMFGSLLQLCPDPWRFGYCAMAGAGSFCIVAFLMCMGFERRDRVGKDLAMPGLLLHAAGLLAWFASV
jgi:hypothetical protein